MDFAAERERMVATQVERRGVRDTWVLEAMRIVPRETFLSDEMAEFAYEDSPLPIGQAQTISQPYIVAKMLEAAELGPGDRVLEVGTGSGYAAAVMAQICREVYSIERHASLAELAGRHVEALGYTNIHIRTGDGTQGWPAAAPFDAIIVAAGGPRIPPALCEQLAIGGRLIIPLGEVNRAQKLTKVTRDGAAVFSQEDLGEVSFVPLIGVHGDGRMEPKGPFVRDSGALPGSISRLLRQVVEPLPEPGHPGFGRMIDRFIDADVILLGEASHGTSEFYRARAAVTRHLIEAHGFTTVALEADWPDAAALNRYVRHKPRRDGDDRTFERFPTWMWRNEEMREFVEWLRLYNSDAEPDRQAGFYGLDLYNFAASIRAVVDYLDEVDPQAAHVARQRYGCLQPWQNEPQAYGRMALVPGFRRCEKPVLDMLTEMLQRQLDYAAADNGNFLDAAGNARLVRAAEAYYRALYYGSADSWNLRDQHMFNTLRHVMDAQGPGTRAVVWAHNSHIGDAAHTEMGLMRDQINLGQLCREAWGVKAVLVGFGTHTGTVAAASEWDGPMEIKRVMPSLPDSYERLAHDTEVERFLLDLRSDIGDANDEVRRRLLQARLERFIGVIYLPESERRSHYAECSLPRQFDAYVWMDHTSAVVPLGGAPRPGEEDTYPFGL